MTRSTGHVRLSLKYVDGRLRPGLLRTRNRNFSFRYQILNVGDLTVNSIVSFAERSPVFSDEVHQKLLVCGGQGNPVTLVV
jgi:hypothetical protein